MNVVSELRSIGEFEYEQENKKVAKKRLWLYEKTAQSYGNMTPAIADSLSAQSFLHLLPY